jgi:hypothetical protein
MSLRGDKRKYYIFDSFRGFPEFSENDPEHLRDSYNFDYNLPRILNLFSTFKKSKIISGFIPDTFKEIDKSERFSLVFYDCDLYQPALDTYKFFWSRMKKGSILLIHDNIATKEGFKGVRKATEEFFIPRGVKFVDFWETTMAVIIK